MSIESLLSAFATLYTPFKIAIADYTFNIVCCTSSFFVPSKPMTPVAIVAAPASPYNALIPASSLAVSLDRSLVAAAASATASLYVPA